jgi:hypothetical protein
MDFGSFVAGGAALAALAGAAAWLVRRRRGERRLYWILRPGAAPQGPVDPARLRAMLADGRLPADTLVAAVGSIRWRPAEAVLARSDR